MPAAAEGRSRAPAVLRWKSPLQQAAEGRRKAAPAAPLKKRKKRPRKFKMNGQKSRGKAAPAVPKSKRSSPAKAAEVDDRSCSCMIDGFQTPAT